MKQGGDVASKHLTDMMGDTQEYYIKGDRYKYDLNGAFIKYQVYSPSEKRLYSKLNGVDTLYWNDVTKDPDPVVDWEAKKELEDVMGVKCSVLVVRTKSGATYTYYFDSKLAVDPNLYKDHNYGNFIFVTEKGRALPLKSVIDDPRFTMTSIATKVDVQKLDDSIFAIPADLPKKASPF